MINITTIPAGTASATTQEVVVEITEPACRPYCINSQGRPSASVVFTQGTLKEVNGITIVPVIATMTIVTPSQTGCGCAHTQVVTESFELGFTSTTANTITLTPGTSAVTEPADLRCCKARSVKLTTTLTATIA